MTVEILAALVAALALTGGFRSGHDEHVHASVEGERLRHRHAWVGPHEHGPATHVHEAGRRDSSSVELGDETPEPREGSGRATAAADATAVAAVPAADRIPRLAPARAPIPEGSGAVAAVWNTPAPSGDAPSGPPTTDRPRACLETQVESLPTSPSTTVCPRGPPSLRAA